MDFVPPADIVQMALQPSKACATLSRGKKATQLALSGESAGIGLPCVVTLTESSKCSYNGYIRSEAMISVGVRQLKNCLTRYLHLVDHGQTLLVTNRDRVVAVLKKPDRNSASTVEEKLAALVAEGKLLPALPPHPSNPSSR
jgi:antitoxin (DNA-binding transcriptional repressor) of toxin-antitoxin stability system